MNFAEVAQAAYAAGIKDPDDLARAVAIAFAESSGNPRAHNPVPPDDSYGLWQINMRGDLGPARRKQFGITSNDQLFDPATNARAMVAISGGGKNWQPWSTYNGLQYLSFLPAGRIAAAGVISGASDALAGAKDKAQEAKDAITEATQTGVGQLVKAGTWLSDRNNWFRIGKVVVGAGLILGGLQAISQGYAAKVAAPIVGAVTPVGKAAKAVGGMVKK